MSTNQKTIAEAAVTHVSFSKGTLKVALRDGRTLTIPLHWYPRLEHGTPAERGNWRLLGDGYGIHWPDLDEDLCVEHLLEGRRSAESERSFRAWLERRPKPRTPRTRKPA